MKGIQTVSEYARHYDKHKAAVTSTFLIVAPNDLEHYDTHISRPTRLEGCQVQAE